MQSRRAGSCRDRPNRASATEDIGDTALSYAEGKALASGDPRIMALAKAESEATKMERLERA